MTKVVRITGISRKDAYYDEREKIIGTIGIIEDESEYEDNDGYTSASFTPKHNNRYFERLTTAHFHAVKYKELPDHIAVMYLL